MAVESGDVTERLDEVGLALTVAPEERSDAGPQLEIDLGVAAEVGEGQSCDVHGNRR